MTIEKMCFIKPEDVKAAKISCKACGSSTIVPLKEINNIAVLLERDCVVCGSSTGFTKGSREWEDVILLGEKLGRLADTMKARGITYSLRIECPTESANY
jgi:hypothetical protein